MVPTQIIDRRRLLEEQSLETWISRLLLFFFTAGTLAHLLPTVRPLTVYVTDLFLLFCNGLIIFSLIQRHQGVRLKYWLVIAYLLTFFTEVLGVQSGQVFGEYAYGRTMRWQYLGVPFVIALNWVVLTLAANQLIQPLFDSLKRRATNSKSRTKQLLQATIAALSAGLVLAAYDLAIEPVAIELDYWQWTGGEIPLQNYLAWAIVAAFVSWPLHYWRIRFESPLLMTYFWAQLAFFITLNLSL